MTSALRPTLLVLALASVTGSAWATTVAAPNGYNIAAPSYEWTNNGTADVLSDSFGIPSSSGSFNPNIYAIDPAGGGITFQHAFTSSPGSSLSNSTGTNPNIWNFQDTIAFTLSTPVNGDVLTATLNLGSSTNLSNLQIRLYGWTNGGGVSNPTTGLASGLPTVPNQVISWQSGAGGVITASFANVPSGTYYLDIRGNVTGTQGGLYVGALNVAPVPLPAALPLLMSGLGLLSLRRRRTN
jgi:hypothetical protein